MTENIVHKKYRILEDALNDIWDRISMWRAAEDISLTSGTDLETDLGNKDAKISALFANLAASETSPAEHAHVVGEIILYQEQLYRVKTAIAIGNTLTVGTNIEVYTVGKISNQLMATDGTQFYFDKSSDKYGYYPNASKTSGQFVPIT